MSNCYDDTLPVLEDECNTSVLKSRIRYQPSLSRNIYETKTLYHTTTPYINRTRKLVMTEPFSHGGCIKKDANNYDRAHTNLSRKLLILIKVLLLSLLCGNIFFCKVKILPIKRQEANDVLIELNRVLESTDDAKKKLAKIQSDLRDLKNTADIRGEKNTREFQEMRQKDEVVNTVTGKYLHQTQKLEDLKTRVQALHKAELEKRFGPGPYFVEFQVLIHGKRHFFTLKTAPIDVMPHSIFIFMDMIDRKVWDNTVLIHHWTHIIQAAPITPQGINMRENVQGELSFPEHSDFFRHEKYTVGFSGRPGGPEWYINFMDNYESHGPGRQAHSKILNDADPCFAEVVRGHNVIDLLERISKETIKRKNLERLEFSLIETARIIEPKTSEM